MLNTMLSKFKELEDMCKRIMKSGLYFSFILCVFSAFILLVYQSFYAIPILYYIGINLFTTSLIFAVEFIICGLAVDSIKKQMI